MFYSRKSILRVFSLVFISVGMLAQNSTLNQTFEKKLFSPDKNYEFVVQQKQDVSGANSLIYRLNFKNKPVILDSGLDIKLDNRASEWALAIKNTPTGNWMDGLVLKEVKNSSVDTSWVPPYGERKIIKEKYKELVLTFEQKVSSNYKMDLQIRLYDEGLAMRYYFRDNPTGIYYKITEENTEFTFPENTMAWFEPWAQAPLTLKSLKDWTSQTVRPLTLQLENGLYACLAEANMVDYVKLNFDLAKTKKNTIKTVLYESVDKVPYFPTPWRVVMAAETPGKLIEHNDLLLNLNEPNRLGDVSWVKPGKIVRDLTLTEKGAKAWIDFAAQHHLQYVLFDWKWYGPAFTFDSDAGKVAIDLDLPEVIRYGKEKGIGIWLYVNQQALLKQDAEIFPIYKKWGIAGVKYGFVEVGSHRWTTWLHESIQRAADNKLMVNIHDEFRLTGEQRTWPNVLTVEGIRGNEEMPDATHNTTLPFTRGIAGAGDYTVCYYTNRIKTTHAHQLALSVVMYSPLQTLFWYDNASNYGGEPEIEFFDKVPTVWDDTKVLNGEIGKYITTARKSGNDWFVGSITNNETRTLELDFNFLDANKKYRARLYTDDETIKTKTQVALKDVIVKKGAKMKLNLKASGGATIWITEVKK
ncbi:glycoside hydrolase family 97 protein [Flavobacterium gawalongense]|nr:glycoside hydrolase family 97 protein [Flavobacterium gawalongense]